MPITRSAKKALRVSDKKRAFNLRRKDIMQKSIKGLKKTVAGNNKEEVAKSLSAAYKALDKAAKSGFIKKNTASRRKARLSRLAKKVSA
jgi:small subunit ribosomal protein S20